MCAKRSSQIRVWNMDDGANIGWIVDAEIDQIDTEVDLLLQNIGNFAFTLLEDNHVNHHREYIKNMLRLWRTKILDEVIFVLPFAEAEDGWPSPYDVAHIPGDWDEGILVHLRTKDHSYFRSSEVFESFLFEFDHETQGKKVSIFEQYKRQFESKSRDELIALLVEIETGHIEK